MSNESSTHGQSVSGRRSDAKRGAEAAELVGEADELVAEVLKPGRWPQRRTVERFLDGDRLERVLSLCGRAMRLDPDEAAYPWNLASTLNRLGLNDLALGFITRAIHLAETAGDKEWSGADAYLAKAEIAINAGETDIALTSLAKAMDLSGERDREQVDQLLRAVEKSSHEPEPRAALAGRLERLAV